MTAENKQGQPTGTPQKKSSPENESPKDKLTISYNPNDMIDLLEKKGYITTHFLMRQLECGDTEASCIINDLEQLQIVSSGDDDWIIDEERGVAEGTYSLERASRLTEMGRYKKGSFNQRRFELTPMPSLAKASTETANDVLDAIRAMGMNLDDLAEMMRTHDPKLSELFKQREIAILREFSPEELRQLADDIKLLRRHPESNE